MDFLRDALSKARSDRMDAHQDQLSTLDSCFAKAASIVEVWNKTGICVVSEVYEEHIKSWMPGVGAISSTLRVQASKDDRPFLLARTNNKAATNRLSAFYTHLTVPNSPRMNCVVAGLLVVSTEVDISRMVDWADKPLGPDHRDAIGAIVKAIQLKPVVRINTPRQWHFYFNEIADSKGPELFASFGKQCAEDPQCRVALRLP